MHIWHGVNPGEPIDSYEEGSYVGNNNRTHYVWYRAAGPDGVWLTPDDIRLKEVFYETAF
jgi:hypothetical protein